MKKIISVILLISILMLIFCSCDTLSAVSSDLEIKYKIENGEATVTKLPDNSTLPEIVIPDEYESVPVTAVADFAGVNLEYVNKITIGKNVKTISLWAFENSKKITAFEVDDNNEYFCDKEGVLYTKDMKTLVFYPLAAGIKTVTDENGNSVSSVSYSIPEGVETIRTKAFYKCEALTEITLPSTLKSIEEKAFFRTSIKEAALPEGLTYIGKDAFAYCTGLKEITIPSTIEEIGEYAFYNSKNLIDITVNTKEENIKLGKLWYSTDNGQSIDELVISFSE